MTVREPPPDDVECIALRSVNPGRGYMVGAGENFWAMAERAAELICLGSAVLRDPDHPSAVAAVVAFDRDPENRKWIDRRAALMLLAAWASGLRPD